MVTEDLLGDTQGRLLRRGGELGAAFDQFRGRADDETGEAAKGTRGPDLGEGGGVATRLAEEREGAVVGVVEEAVEGAVAEDGRCGSYITLNREPMVT
jgi:hypothetical protein